MGYVGLGATPAASASPVGAAISAGVNLATTAAGIWEQNIQLSHAADTATTQIVNGLAPKLQAIVDAYMAGPRTCADQAAAMSAYLTAVNWLYSAAGCGNGAYGSAGNRCISDRFGPGGPTDPNAQYPWAAYYYLPIANDPQAAGCAAAISSSNPNAALQAAINNAIGTVTGNPIQQTAGTVGTASTSSGFDFTTPVLGFPLWAWLAGGVGLLVALK